MSAAPLPPPPRLHAAAIAPFLDVDRTLVEIGRDPEATPPRHGPAGGRA